MNKKAGTILAIAAAGLVLSLLTTGPVQAVAKAAQEVFVTNTEADPVPTKQVGTVAVRDTDQQYTTQVSFGADGTEAEVCSDQPFVPEGKRMVVETVIVEVRDGATAPNLFLYGTGARPYLSLTKVQDAADAPGSWVSGSNTYWGATEQLHLILGPTPSGSDDGTLSAATLTAKVCVHPKGETRWTVVQFNGVLEDVS